MCVLPKNAVNKKNCSFVCDKYLMFFWNLHILVWIFFRKSCTFEIQNILDYLYRICMYVFSMYTQYTKYIIVLRKQNTKKRSASKNNTKVERSVSRFLSVLLEYTHLTYFASLRLGHEERFFAKIFSHLCYF